MIILHFHLQKQSKTVLLYKRRVQRGYKKLKYDYYTFNLALLLSKSRIKHKSADVRPICTNTFRATKFDWGPLNLSKQMFDIRARVMTVELDTSGHVSENITPDSHDS